MSFLAAIRVALGALLIHKGRSALTSLGIIIGIGAVIALVSAGSGARLKLDEQLSNVGKDVILIRAGARNQQGMVTDFVSLTFTRETGMPDAMVAPVSRLTNDTVAWRMSPAFGSAAGSTAVMSRIVARRVTTASGSFAAEVEANRTPE